jgi:hypothetical protein
MHPNIQRSPVFAGKHAGDFYGIKTEIPPVRYYIVFTHKKCIFSMK